jgi:hypothetical protein
MSYSEKSIILDSFSRYESFLSDLLDKEDSFTLLLFWFFGELIEKGGKLSISE